MTVARESFEIAFWHFQSGNLRIAEKICRKLIQADGHNPDILYLMGLIAHQYGQYLAALEFFNIAIDSKPHEPQFYNDKGLALAALGKPDEAAEAFQKAIDLKPNFAESYFNLGLAKSALGQIEAAIENYKRVLRLRPEYAEAYYNLANVLLSKGELDSAIENYRMATGLKPDWAEAYHNLGIALKVKGKIKKAVKYFERAIQLNPDFSEAYLNIAISLQRQGNLAQALAYYKKTLELNPNNAQAYFNLGMLHQEINRTAESIACYQKALRIQPKNTETYNNLGNIFYRQGKINEAISCYQKALELNPHYAGAHYNMANALHAKDKLTEAISYYQKTLTLKPSWAEAYNNMGTAYQNQGDLSKAICSFRKALEIRPDYAEAINNLGIVYRNQGRIKDALTCYRAALRREPDNAETHSNLLFCLNYDPAAHQKDLFAQASNWWNQHGKPVASQFSHENPKNPHRRLKIGYVSPDFRRHPVGFFFLPLVAAHKHDDFEIFCYSDVKLHDEITDQIKKISDQWCSTTGLTDMAVAAKVYVDQIDILVDLAGHTANNRLLVFARKPAPIQVNWLGYVNTTGMPVMDYRLTDQIVNPEEEGNQDHSETLVRLENGFFCYAPPENSPEINCLPAQKNNRITFGSFNNLSKINKNVIAVWSQILHKAPGSRLMLRAKPLTDPSTRKRYLELFFENDISSDRIEMIPYTPSFFEYLRLYHKIDIGLDPYPHNGHATTCDSLWMGVPVITLRGDRYAARMGACILSRLNLREFIAETMEDYLAKAIILANDIDRLIELRFGMRKQIKSSPIFDVGAFTESIENAYRRMWYKWSSSADESRR